MEIADGRIFIVVLFSDWCSLFLDHDAESLSNLPRIQGQKDGCFKLDIRTKIDNTQVKVTATQSL